MIQAWIAGAIAKFSKHLVVFGSALAGIAFLFLSHKYKVNKAEDEGREEGLEKGREDEQQRVAIETELKTKQIKEKADEIKETIDRGTADLDNLRRRMRASATDAPDQRDH